MLKRPLFTVAIAFAAGIWVPAALGMPVEIALVGCGFGICTAIVMKRPSAAVLFVIAALGILRYDASTFVAADDVSRFARSRVTAVHGQICSDVDLREDCAYIPLQISGVESHGRLIPASGDLMLTYYRPSGDPDWTPPSYGDVLTVRTTVSLPSTTKSAAGYSRSDRLAQEGIYAVAYVRDPPQVEIVRSDPPNRLMWVALQARQALEGSIYRSMPHEEASVVVGMDLGTYTSLPNRLLTNFQRTGTLHLLAASGFNCAVIILVFGYILKHLKQPRRVANPILIGLLIFYMLMVGSSPSIVRATVMAALLLMGGLLKRPADVLNLLFGAVLVILAVNPTDLFSVSFQLSFAAVLALILVMPVIEHVADRWRDDVFKKKRRSGWLHRVTMPITKDAWQGLTATTAATLGTLPLSVHYFNQLSLVSVVVNVIVASAVLPIFAVGLAMPIAAHIPGIGPAAAYLGAGLTRVTLSAINWFGELPGSCLYVPSPGPAGIVGYYVLLGTGVWYANQRIAGKKRADTP